MILYGFKTYTTLLHVDFGAKIFLFERTLFVMMKDVRRNQQSNKELEADFSAKYRKKTSLAQHRMGLGACQAGIHIEHAKEISGVEFN